MSGSLRFLTGSNAKLISLLSFDTATKTISPVQHTTVDPAPSWVEPATHASLKGKNFYSLSEEDGKALALELGADGKVQIIDSASTGGNPAHIHSLKDGSGIVATNYMGGSAVFYPVDPASGKFALPSSILSEAAAAIPASIKSVLPAALQPPPPTPLLKFQFTYTAQSTGPNAERQESSHPHQCIEGPNGDLYVPDLGSDRIWVITRAAENALAWKGELELPAGSGPRHAAISPDGRHLYVITELTHRVLIFKLPSSSDASAYATAIKPIDELGGEIAPPAVPASLRPKMTAGELILSPISPRTLYASNRGQVDLNGESAATSKVEGDAIAIVSLSESGDAVEAVNLVQTGVNFIRGMAVTSDGKYLGITGQKDGNIEIYQVGGQNAEKLELVAQLDGSKSGLDLPTDFLWI